MNPIVIQECITKLSSLELYGEVHLSSANSSSFNRSFAERVVALYAKIEG